MKIKLERLGVPSVPKIESLAHGELIRLEIQMRERILIYEGTIFRSKEREFGKSSERGSSTPAIKFFRMLNRARQSN